MTWILGLLFCLDPAIARESVTIYSSGGSAVGRAEFTAEEKSTRVQIRFERHKDATIVLKTSAKSPVGGCASALSPSSLERRTWTFPDREWVKDRDLVFEITLEGLTREDWGYAAILFQESQGSVYCANLRDHLSASGPRSGKRRPSSSRHR